MFELFSGDHRRVPHRDTVPLTLASKPWRYSPSLLNGRPERFV